MIRPYRMWLLSGLLVAAGCHLALSLDDLEITEGAGGSAGGNGGQAGHQTGGGGSTGGGGGSSCSPATCPDPGEVCMVAACDESDACTSAIAPEGTDCVGQGDAKVCDTEGNCVVCSGTFGCEQGMQCFDGSCVLQSCLDGEQGELETDVDCGGPDCPPCANNGKCLETRDCESAFCDLSGGSPGECSPCVTFSTDCDADRYCDPTDKTCKLKQDPGGPCTLPNECLSGFCVDDVCCDSACPGFCQACSEAKHQIAGENGHCRNIPINQDPDGECAVGEGCDGNGTDCTGCGVTHPAPGGSSCPAECTGGCSNNTCRIDCTVSACTVPVACPPGYHCLVDCSSPGACTDIMITCPADIYDCQLVCGDNSTGCSGTSLKCGSGPCTMTCGMCGNAVMQCGSDSCHADCLAGGTGPTLPGGSSCDPVACN